MSKVKSHLLQLFITENSNNLQFEWIDYGNDSTFTGNPVASEVDSEFLQSLWKYIEKQSDIKGRISIPNFLELNTYENTIYPRNTISHLHSGTFLLLKKVYKVSTKMDKFVKSLNKYALNLNKEFSNNDDHPNKKDQKWADLFFFRIQTYITIKLSAYI